MMENPNPAYSEHSMEMARLRGDTEIDLEGATAGRNKPSVTKSASTILDQMPSRMHHNVASGLTMDRVSGPALKRSKTKRHHRGHSSMRLPKDVNLEGVASSLLDDPDFVDGTVEDQNADIKQLPLNLSDRRAVREKIKKSSTRRKEGARLSCWKTMKYSCSLRWRRFKINLAECTYSLELWRGHIKTIEGKFGTGVTSYFLFLKWLILLNVPLFLLLFCLIVLPQILYNVYSAPYFLNTCESNATFSGEELLTGQGWFLGTVLYYGCYLGGKIQVIGNIHYNMEYAYLLVIIAYYILTLIGVLYSLTKAYKKSYIDSSGTMRVYYVIKVLSGWDHNITDAKAAALRHGNITKEFQEYLETIRDKQQQHTFFQLCCLAWFRIIANMVILLVLGGSGYLVWYLSETQSLKSDIKLWNDLALPFAVSAINYLLPFLFSLVAGWERYKNPRTALYLTMLRTMTLYCITLGVIVAFWLGKIDCAETTSDRHCRPCWENFMGHQMYKLVVMDFLFTIGVTFASEFIVRLLSQCSKRIDKPQFDIGRNTLYLVYPQALVWIGAFYSPLLPILVIIKFVIVFYLKRFSVVFNCAAPKRAWRGVQTHMVIMGILLFNLLLCSSSFIYSIVRIKPSKVCGPYQDFNKTYGVITQNVDRWREEVPAAGHVIEFVTSNEFLACILIALCVGVYYTSVMADGLKEMVTIMDKQIRLEGEDKLFLLKLLYQIGASRPPSGYQRSQSMPPSETTPRPETPSPTLSGRRRFAKYAIQDRLKSPSGGTPPSSPLIGQRGSQTHLYDSPKPRYETPLRARHSPIASRRRRPMSVELVNQSYQDGGRDSPNRLSIVGPPSGPSTPDVANPSYTEGSPNNRPHLPYPGRPYDMISSEKSQRI